MFISYLRVKCHISAYSVLLSSHLQSKAKENIVTVSTLLLHVLKNINLKDYFYKQSYLYNFRNLR
jgi:hypothetical protein